MQISESSIHAQQQCDQGILKTIKMLSEGELADYLAATYKMTANMLYRKIQRNCRIRCLPIIPRGFRWSIINQVHESILH